MSAAADVKRPDAAAEVNSQTRLIRRLPLRLSTAYFAPEGDTYLFINEKSIEGIKLKST